MPIAVLNGARHYFRLEGSPSKPPLMLVHPVGADHSLWDRTVSPLTEHFHVLRYDLRGHGGSEATPGEYSIDLLSRDLLAMADAVAWRRFSACGVSIGAMAVIHAAAHAPERIEKLVICSAAPAMAQPPGGWDARARGARESGMAASAEAMVSRMFSAEHRATHDPLVDTLRTVYERTSPEGFAASLAVLRDADLRPLLPRVAANTLVVTGRLDPLVPATAAQALLAGIAGSRHVVLDGGHFPPVEEPFGFVDAVLPFLLD